METPSTIPSAEARLVEIRDRLRDILRILHEPGSYRRDDVAGQVRQLHHDVDADITARATRPRQIHDGERTARRVTSLEAIVGLGLVDEYGLGGNRPSLDARLRYLEAMLPRMVDIARAATEEAPR